jgi:hypothetical protein
MPRGGRSEWSVAAAFHDPARSRLSIALGAALALHAVTALVGHRMGGAVATAATDEPAAVKTEIELFDAPADPAAGEDMDLRESVRAALAARSSVAHSRDHRGNPPAGISPERARAEPSDEPTTAPSELGTADGSYALDPSAATNTGARHGGAPIDLGIGAGDWSRWVDPRTSRTAAERPGRAPLVAPPVSSTGGLAEALEAHDQKIGLGPAGAVLTAVHDAGYSEIAPAIGTATFSITVLRSGAVDVQLTGATSQAAEWAKLGESIAAAIRRKPPRISETRIGVRLGIEVVAEERWPNGQPTRLDSGPKLAATPPKFQAVETAKQSLLERNPAAVPDPDAPAGKPPPLQANYEAPFVGIQGRGKVCSYKIGLSPIPISGGCDPANIGAKARRVVSTRVTSQTML